MKAIILAGGLGTRLRPFTEVIPKPLLPIGEKAVLEIQIERLAAHGIKDIYLATNYKSDYIKNFFGTGERYGINFHISKEEKPLGTAGPISLLRDELDDDFIVMNGDILSLVDYTDMLDFAKNKDSLLTIAIKKEIMPFAFGNIFFDGDFVTGIEEKPDLPSSESAKAFLEYILVYNSHMSARGSLSPDTIELVRERVIDYLLWCDGGDAVALPEINRDVVFTIGSTDFMANGVPMEMTVEPIIIDGFTFIPARYLVEPLGGEALWDGETRSVVLIALGHRIQLSIDKTEATSDGEPVSLSRPPTIVNGRTLIPLRAASVLLGAEVSWNSDTKEATCQFNLGVRPLYGE